MIKFSIVTPTFNSAVHIHDCILSVLEQSFDDFEHIIIDNLSTDTTLQIITEMYGRAGKSSKLKIISEADTGIADAFNKGVMNASGQFILILNSDDRLYDKLISSLPPEIILSFMVTCFLRTLPLAVTGAHLCCARLKRLCRIIIRVCLYTGMFIEVTDCTIRDIV
ncbi:MAG: glycosyltransferase [Ignavibacteriales bacterium]|nr:glycosyltransferase [Ignavibacteriales bacterium]